MLIYLRPGGGLAGKQRVRGGWKEQQRRNNSSGAAASSAAASSALRIAEKALDVVMGKK